MSRIVPLLSGLLGGLVAVVVGALLISTGVIDTGERTREVVRQEAVTRPAADGDEEGLTVSDIFREAGPGVVFIRADVPADAGGDTPSARRSARARPPARGSCSTARATSSPTPTWSRGRATCRSTSASAATTSTPASWAAIPRPTSLC
ncbi:MAG: hypothetical protein WKF31_01700 [Thermoleophilaceae bacterium]